MHADPRQLGIFDQPLPAPGGVRHDDPETSMESAESVDAINLEKMVYEYMVRRGIPVSLDDVVRDLKLDKVTASPRFKPLERAGMITRAGKRPGNSGRPQTIWKVVSQ